MMYYKCTVSFMLIQFDNEHGTATATATATAAYGIWNMDVELDNTNKRTKNTKKNNWNRNEQKKKIYLWRSNESSTFCFYSWHIAFAISTDYCDRLWECDMKIFQTLEKNRWEKTLTCAIVNGVLLVFLFAFVRLITFVFCWSFGLVWFDLDPYKTILIRWFSIQATYLCLRVIRSIPNIVRWYGIARRETLDSSV